MKNETLIITLLILISCGFTNTYIDTKNLGQKKVLKNQTTKSDNGKSMTIPTRNLLKNQRTKRDNGKSITKSARPFVRNETITKSNNGKTRKSTRHFLKNQTTKSNNGKSMTKSTKQFVAKRCRIDKNSGYRCCSTTESYPDNSFKVELCNIENIEYAGFVYLGIPHQVRWVEFDTGSHMLWMMAKMCNSETCKEQKRFDFRTSFSFIPGRSLSQIQYVDDYMLGLAGKDYVCFDKACLANQSVTIGMDVKMANGFTDGIMGLNKQSAVFENLKKILPRQLFAVYMTSVESHTQGGEITFGYVNANRYYGPLFYRPSVSKDHWKVEFDKVEEIYPNKTRKELTCMRGTCTGIVDTGTSFIYPPVAHSYQILERWRSAKLIESLPDGEYNVLLNPKFAQQLSTFVFHLGNKTLTISPADYTYVSEHMGHVLAIGEQNGAEDGKTWLLGMAFLRAYYTVFVFGQGQDMMGFAKIKHEANS